MKIVVLRDEVFNKAGGVAAANDGGLVLGFAEEFGDDGGSGGVGGVFGTAEDTIPDDSLSIDDVIREVGGRERANVELGAGAVLVKIAGDGDVVMSGLVAVGGDFATDKNMVGMEFVSELVDERLFVFDFGAAENKK